ncbi:MAG: YggT family protein [Culicoidibacterales bacterium]
MSLVFEFLMWLLDIYAYGLLIYVLATWVPPIYRFIYPFFSPLYKKPLEIVGRIIPPFGMLDFSPVILFVAIQLVMRGLAFLYVFFL